MVPDTRLIDWQAFRRASLTLPTPLQPSDWIDALLPFVTRLDTGPGTGLHATHAATVRAYRALLAKQEAEAAGRALAAKNLWVEMLMLLPADTMPASKAHALNEVDRCHREAHEHLDRASALLDLIDDSNDLPPLPTLDHGLAVEDDPNAPT
jgi:hypothetical protein